MKKPWIVWGVLAGMVAWLGCDAPRLNPLDPRAENALGIVETELRVQHLLNPQVGIAGVLAVEPQLQLSGISDAQGKILWMHSRVDSIEVMFSKEGYFPATFRYPIRAASNQVVAFLNAKPQIRRLKFVTVHNTASKVDYIHIEATIIDPDGDADIQAVKLRNVDSSFALPLSRTDSTFSAFFNKNQISPALTAGELPGLSFQLVVYNTNGDSIVEDPLILRRVIDTELTPLLPNSDRAESGSILFTWKAVDLDFPFNYRVILYSSTGTIAKIGEFYPISSSATQFELADSTFLAKMETGTYLWNLEVEDQFGNIAESRVLQFQYFK